MKKLSAVIISLVVSIGLSACSQDVSASSDRSIRRLEQRIEELEAENSELRAQLEMQETSSEQSDDDQELISSIMDSPEESGKCGAQLTWYYKDFVLYITGSGEMAGYSSAGTPWYDLRDKIDCVIVDGGVSTIGNFAFYNLIYLTKVVLPDSVTSIGQEAFECCYCLTEITMPDSVTSIGYDAFYGCSNLTIYYSGNALDEYINSYQDEWNDRNITWIKQ